MEKGRSFNCTAESQTYSWSTKEEGWGWARAWGPESLRHKQKRFLSLSHFFPIFMKFHLLFYFLQICNLILERKRNYKFAIYYLLFFKSYNHIPRKKKQMGCFCRNRIGFSLTQSQSHSLYSHQSPRRHTFMRFAGVGMMKKRRRETPTLFENIYIWWFIIS